MYARSILQALICSVRHSPAPLDKVALHWVLTVHLLKDYFFFLGTLVTLALQRLVTLTFTRGVPRCTSVARLTNCKVERDSKTGLGRRSLCFSLFFTLLQHICGAPFYSPLGAEIGSIVYKLHFTYAPRLSELAQEFTLKRTPDL